MQAICAAAGQGKVIIMIIIVLNMLMPVQHNSFTHLRVLLVLSLSAAFGVHAREAKEAQKLAPDTAGKGWFDLPAQV